MIGKSKTRLTLCAVLLPGSLKVKGSLRYQLTPTCRPVDVEIVSTGYLSAVHMANAPQNEPFLYNCRVMNV